MIAKTPTEAAGARRRRIANPNQELIINIVVALLLLYACYTQLFACYDLCLQICSKIDYLFVWRSINIPLKSIFAANAIFSYYFLCKIYIYVAKCMIEYLKKPEPRINH